MINFQPFQNLYQGVKKYDIKLFEALDKISSYLQSLSNLADFTISQSDRPNAPGNVTEITLIAPSTVISNPSVTSGLFGIIIFQGSVDGNAVVFSSNYIGGPALAQMINTTANTYSALMFKVLNSGKYALVSIVTGVPVV